MAVQGETMDQFILVGKQGKRKPMDSLPSSAAKKPLPQYNVDTAQRFEILNNAKEGTVAAKTKTPPIIVDAKSDEIENLLAHCASVIGVGNFTAKILSRSGRVRINPNTKQLHGRLTVSLARKSQQFHSFTAESERDFTAVILGLYEASPDTVKLAITNAGIQSVKSVVNRKNKANIPLFVARFARGSTNLRELREKCRLLCNCVVTWELFSPAVKEYTQCFNCQQFGHAASNCSRNPRCVKCLETHEKGNCKRQTKEGTAKCVNCKGDHAANYKGCTTYQKYKSVRVAAQEHHIRPRPTFAPAQAPAVNFWEQRAAAALKPQQVPNPTPIAEKPPPKPKETTQQPTRGPANIFEDIKNQAEELRQIPNIQEIFEEVKKLIQIIKASRSTQEAALNIAMFYIGK